MSNKRISVGGSGISMGSAFAIILSWTTWKSFWWAIVHGVLGWLYVGYYFLVANYDSIYL